MFSLMKFFKRKERPIAKRKGKYPFDQLELGQSFAFDKAHAQRVRSAACYYAKRHGRKFTVVTRKATARCWRVA
jgi:hypothetical protein